MKLYSIFKFIDDDDGLWVVTSIIDKCNYEAQPVGCDGIVLLCINPKCDDNDIDNIKIIK